MALLESSKELERNQDESFPDLLKDGCNKQNGSPKSKYWQPQSSADIGEDAGTSACRRDPRVRCFSQRLLLKLLENSDLLTSLLDRQKHLSEDRKAIALKQLKLDFEIAIQDNVTINGEPWQQTSEKMDHLTGHDFKALEDQFDENIVETTTKRKQYPRKIAAHFIKILKTEREMMGLHRTDIKPETVTIDPAQLSRMTELVSYASSTARQTTASMKSLLALLQKAEGLSQALSIQPALNVSKTHKAVFKRLRVREREQMNGFFTQSQTTQSDMDSKGKLQTCLQKKRRLTESAQGRIYHRRSTKTINLNG